MHLSIDKKNIFGHPNPHSFSFFVSARWLLANMSQRSSGGSNSSISVSSVPSVSNVSNFGTNDSCKSGKLFSRSAARIDFHTICDFMMADYNTNEVVLVRVEGAKTPASPTAHTAWSSEVPISLYQSQYH